VLREYREFPILSKKSILSRLDIMKRVEQTLIEQMQMSDSEINLRKELLNFTEDDIKALTDSKSYILDSIDTIVETFYQNQTQIDEIILLIGDADTLSRLNKALRTYINELFSGYYDNEYVNNRLRIGMVHKRIGVEPKLYLSAIRTLKDILREELRRSITDKKLLSDTLYALEKLFYFDTTLVFDTYIESLLDEVNSAKKKTERYAESLEKKVAERTKQLEELSKIDFLTNLFNQRSMYDSLRKELLRSIRNKTKISCIYIDIDDFKQINDEEGHIKGDEVLKYLGKSLLTNIRAIDIACRYGGDEFVVILPNCDIENAMLVIKKIIKKFSEKYPLYSLSIGIAETGIDNYIDSDKLIDLADKKMYLAKKKAGMHIEY